jgi:hypothetical protein
MRFILNKRTPTRGTVNIYVFDSLHNNSLLILNVREKTLYVFLYPSERGFSGGKSRVKSIVYYNSIVKELGVLLFRKFWKNEVLLFHRTSCWIYPKIISNSCFCITIGQVNVIIIKKKKKI